MDSVTRRAAYISYNQSQNHISAFLSRLILFLAEVDVFQVRLLNLLVALLEGLNGGCYSDGNSSPAWQGCLERCSINSLLKKYQT